MPSAMLLLHMVRRQYHECSVGSTCPQRGSGVGAGGSAAAGALGGATVFEGGCTVAGAAAVVGWDAPTTQQVLTSLIERSLLGEAPSGRTTVQAGGSSSARSLKLPLLMTSRLLPLLAGRLRRKIALW